MGRAHLVLVWTAIGDIAREAVEAVAVLFDKKGLTLDVDVPDELPSVYCDRTRIRQVLLNLLSNAGRFTEVGGARVEARLEEGALRLTVSDTGPGMNPAKLERLFEPFQQEDETIRRRYGGSGLGLAISKRFVEMHGGRIWIDSDMGAGTKVTFTLPVQQAPVDSSPRRWFSPYEEHVPRTRPSLAPTLRPRPRLVILEQGSALLHLVEHYVEGVEAIAVRTSSDAVAAVEADAATAVFINAASFDSAFEGTSAITELSVDVPVMTCWVPERRATIAHGGVQGYLVKPIQRADLLDSIRSACPRARLILVADDDPEARQLFSRMLISAGDGYTVLQAADGETALSILRERRPDLVLLDLVMPQHDGFAVLEAKAADASIRDIPTIIISAKDPQREPIMSRALVVSRCYGLSARDLMDVAQAVIQILRPRVVAPTRSETPVASSACE
jgi:CheY-like chemotaxis protein/anti-sigma regulatory factor (Ser/Thr protein kinase)